MPGTFRDPLPAARKVTWPVLLSAGANLIGAYLWLTTCFGVVLTAPLLVLFLFETVYWVQSEQMSRDDLDRRGRVIAAFEILLGGSSAALGAFTVIHGLLGLISVGCGIALVWRLRQALAAASLDSPRPGAQSDETSPRS